MNYIKSEFYRITHSFEIYRLTLILAGLAILYNVAVSAFLKNFAPDSFYLTTSFSYSNLVAEPMLYCVAGAIVAIALYEGNIQNGNMKNTVSFGISRVTVFIGKCIVSIVSAGLSLLIVLGAFIASTSILMRKAGPVELHHLIGEVPAVFFIAAAALISMLLFMELFEKLGTVVIIWATVWFLIPKVLFYVGLRFSVIYLIAMLLPANLFSYDAMPVNTIQCITAWDTPLGMTKCIIIGITGIVIFIITGIMLLRKKEL